MCADLIKGLHPIMMRQAGNDRAAGSAVLSFEPFYRAFYRAFLRCRMLAVLPSLYLNVYSLNLA